MNLDPFQIVRDFERAICEYTSAKYCICTNSCTNALLIACAYHNVNTVFLPKRTYVGVPMSVIHAGGQIIFEDRPWRGSYYLRPYPIVDSARRFTSDMYRLGEFQCCSFHWGKHLGLGHGGCILHDDANADRTLRKMRFDGRTEHIHPKNDDIILGYHCMMSPEVAAHGLVKLSWLPKDNSDLPTDDYPDLGEMDCFK